MDTFDQNESFEQSTPSQEIPVEEAPSAPYSGAGTGRKESPYANSPYVAYERPQCEFEPAKPQKVKKKKPGAGKKIVAIVLVVALLGGLCGGGYAVWKTQQQEKQILEAQIRGLEDRLNKVENTKTPPSTSGVTIPTDGSALTPAQLYETCVDSVVAISTTVRTQDYFGTTEGTSSGSGFVLTEDGYVVTNCHVVEDATKISVILHDGTEYDAELVGKDANNDVAVLKIEAEGLTAVAIGSSDTTNIGDMVAAIGNPLGELAATMTIGYVSGINREVTTDNTIIAMLQTDAAINPGNSGGPLFNMYGQVIGITTAKYSGTTGSGASIEGIGFAIPLDDVYGMINDLIDYGYVTGAYLGVTVQNMDTETATYYNLPMGAYVVTVEKGGAADEAGIQEKDIIIALGDHKVSSITDLTRALRNFKADETTTITVVRSGQEKVLNITLDEKPQDVDTQTEGPMPSNGSYDEWYDFFFGPDNG